MTLPGPLVETRTLGRWRLLLIQGGRADARWRRDVGIVPKPPWVRCIPADEKNRIQLVTRCVLVEHASGLVLIDSRAGTKENEKFHEICGVENQGALTSSHRA